jgi:Na+-transporting NADH:ubiquinone oxidoreductase subunit A
MIKIKRGLDLPIAGEPRQDIGQGPAIRSVALLGGDYVGMKPTMEVREGDAVKKGQVIFTDKKCEGVKYTAPAAGTIKAVHRGAKRVLLSVEIEVADKEESVSFKQYSADELSGLQAAAVREQLIDSGVCGRCCVPVRSARCRHRMPCRPRFLSPPWIPIRSPPTRT